MSTYKQFAVIGAGALGLPVVKALLERDVSVLIITRPDSSTPLSSFPAAAKSLAVDLSDVTSLASVFHEHAIEVVISMIAHAGLPTQYLQADAAKAASVKLYVSSEFGYPTIGQNQGELGLKETFAGYISSIGLPSSRFFVGGFIEWIPWLVYLPETGKFNICGKGSIGASFTAIDDISGFTAHVLTTLPPSELTNSIFRIEGEHASLAEIAAMYGDKVEVVQVDKFPHDEFRTFLHDLHGKGMASTGYDFATGKELSGRSNKLWAGHRWKGIKEILNI